MVIVLVGSVRPKTTSSHAEKSDFSKLESIDYLVFRLHYRATEISQEIPVPSKIGSLLDFCHRLRYAGRALRVRAGLVNRSQINPVGAFVWIAMITAQKGFLAVRGK